MTMQDPNKVVGRPRQMADSLQWLSYGLILVFLAQVISTLFPIALLQPEWMLRVSGSLLATASLPIIALALIMLANTIDKEVMPSSKHLKLFRRIATFAAIGFLLLIPLQTYATVVGSRSELQKGQAQLTRLVSAGDLVKNAGNEQELRNAIRAIPGAEEVALRPLGADVQTIKKALLDRLRESTNNLKKQLNEAQGKILANSIIPLLRDATIALGYAIGFAGMGYSQFGNPTPLRLLMKATNLNNLRKQGGRPNSRSGRRARGPAGWLQRILGQ
jgi:hypothetical protein